MLSQAVWAELEALPAGDKVALAERLLAPIRANAPADPWDSDSQLKELLDQRWAEYLANPEGAEDTTAMLDGLLAEDK